MAKKRKGDKEDTRNGDHKRRKSTQKGQLSGPGILLTTVRRKERKAGLELIEFLDDLVVELYPDLDLTISEEVSGDGNLEDDDDDLDALINGKPPPSTAANSISASSPPIKAPTKPTINDDIEAQLQAELEELRPKKQTPRNGEKADESSPMNRERKKFTLIDPEVECLMFVSVAWPLDPVRLCCALLDQVGKTGQVRGHFIQRLSPIYMTGRAEGVDRVEILAKEVMNKHYPKSPDHSTFKVESRIRLHNQLHKTDIIKAIAAAVPRPHQANLLTPDLVINVEILKMTIGIGILPRYEEYKRYNPQMIAQKYNEDHKSDGLASRTLLSTQPPSVNQS